MGEWSSYGIVIAASAVIILSYLFHRLAEKTNFPSVLLLILLGMVVREAGNRLGLLKSMDLMPLLELLGIVGLIIIVLEAALDLKLSRDRAKMIWHSVAMSLLALLFNTTVIAWIIREVWGTDWYLGILYAIPLAIMSSAIVIPSVATLVPDKKEFLVYESTLSDIFGIILFYFVVEAGNSDQTAGQMVAGIAGNILLTVIISILSSMLLIYIFQKIRYGTKFFLILAVLTLLYSIGKELHLASLLIVLIFGITLSNSALFRVGFLKRILRPRQIEEVFNDFHIVTVESSFVVRTFFFFIFGLSIVLSSLINKQVVLVSMMILAAIFFIRYFLTLLFRRNNHFPEWLIAPRGLITILLFFSIPHEYHIEDFVLFKGILLFIILFTSLLMGYGLIQHRQDIRKAASADDQAYPKEIEDVLDE